MSRILATCLMLRSSPSGRCGSGSKRGMCQCRRVLPTKLAVKRRPRAVVRPLPIEDAGDDVVRVVDCQTAQERQGLFIGAYGSGSRARQADVALAQPSAAPAQRQMRPVVLPVDGDDDLFEQGAQ